MPDYAELAAAMRAAWRRGRCDSDLPVEVAVRNLEQAAADVERLCEGDVLDLVVLKNDALVRAYGFAAEVSKALDLDHPARARERRPADPASLLPYLRERREQVLAALDDEYPPG